MKLVILYGPPAVGKLTVAKELAAITGYKLFHNHLSVDLVTSIFPYGTGPFWPLVRSIRTEMIAAAVKENVNLIFTFVFAAGEDEELINSYMKIVEDAGSQVCLVQLKTNANELSKRVSQDSRKQYKKISTPEGLTKYMQKYDLVTPIPEKDSLVIDNTQISAAEVAKQIVEHYNL